MGLSRVIIKELPDGPVKKATVSDEAFCALESLQAGGGETEIWAETSAKLQAMRAVNKNAALINLCIVRDSVYHAFHEFVNFSGMALFSISFYFFVMACGVMGLDGRSVSLKNPEKKSERGNEDDNSNQKSP